MKSISKTDIVTGLSGLGVFPGIGVIVHSSLSSFGYVNGGAKTVVEALIEAVTPEGTLLMPSFNHGKITKPGWSGYYDPVETPTVNGAIPETFRKMPGVFRSLNPTHPVAGWGRDAQRYTRFHHRVQTMGLDSPIGKLFQDGGYGLLLGVGFEANTFHHIVETSLKVPCLGVRTEAYPVKLDGGRMVMGRTWGWRNRACPFTDEGRYHPLMYEQNLVDETRIGEARVRLFRLADCYQVVSAILLNGFDGYPPCKGCSIRPQEVSNNVLSDWDQNLGRLMPDSDAWFY